MAMKKCFKCGELKPLSEFYKHKATKDGYLNKCKECTKKDTHNNYIKNKDYYKDYEHSIQRINSRRRRANKYLKKHRKNFPEKDKARRLLNQTIRNNKIIRPGKCSKCNKICIPDAHHEDYSRPLDVVWLCRQCHRQLHNFN